MPHSGSFVRRGQPRADRRSLALLCFLRPLAAAAALTIGLAAGAAAQERLTFGPSPERLVLGGVPSGAPSAQPLVLTLEGAIRRALEHNLGVLAAEHDAERRAGTRWAALSALLPSIQGGVTETRRKTNLEAFGFPLGPGFPSVVGPFNVFDARLTLRQSLFDVKALNDARAESHQLTAARQTSRSARELVILVTASLYLEALAADARLQAAGAQLETSQALHRQAQELRAAGVVAGIDVVRADVRASEDQQAMTAARNALEKARLQLARTVGLPLGQTFTTSEALPTVAFPQASFEDTLAQSYASRPDMLAAQARVRAAEARVRAARGERLPTVSVNGDYGVIGLTVGDSLPTFAVTGAVQVSIFDGGRIRGRLAEAVADLELRRAELEDLRAGVYYGVRTAFLDLETTQEQLTVATRARALADLQLTQARDRFAAGVTDNIEVVQAQEAVAAAAERSITALYRFNLAKALVLGSPGSLEQALDRYFGAAGSPTP